MDFFNRMSTIECKQFHDGHSIASIERLTEILTDFTNLMDLTELGAF